jgi:aromatic-L-amino-acid/L-tryptophan decarboxylase
MRRSRPGARSSATPRRCATRSATTRHTTPTRSRIQIPPIYYHEWSPQNSRGFRALKVWLALRQVGRTGYERMIAEDIRLARYMFDAARTHDELEAVTIGLSIATFRYVGTAGAGPEDRERLNTLNKQIMERVQERGRAFLTNAVLDDTYLLRACIVNFRTGEDDVRMLIDEVIRAGRELSGSTARD